MTILRCIILTFTTILLVNCQRETQVEKANRDKILLVGNGGEPKALDPHLVTGVIESKIISSLFEGLVGDDAESDSVMRPGAALTWEHNPDFTEWIFHLRPEGKWSDGETVTAHDFVFSYNRMLHPDTAAPYVEMLYFIKNAEEFNRGKVLDFEQVGVKAIDDFTLKLVLKEPVPYLPGVTRHYTWFPVPKHVVLSYGKMTDRFTRWSEPGNMVGNGGFVLSSWRLHDHVKVVKNPFYWDAANVQLNGVTYLPIENFYTETRAYLAGQLHVTYQLPPDLVDKMRAEYPKEIREDPYVGSRFVRCNVTRPGLDQVKVRMALSYAIDRKQLCDTILKGYEAADTYSPDLGDYKPESVLGFDPAKAKQLLAEAGYPDGKGFPRYSLLIGSGGTRATSEALQAMWKDNLNILIDIKALDSGSYITAQQKLDFDLALAGWVGDYLDPTTFLLMWTKGNGNNNTGWSSEAFETMLDEAAHNQDAAQRLRIFEKAEKLLMDEQPIIPFAWQAKTYLLSPSVKGWPPLLLDNHPWTAVRLEK